MPAKDLYHVAVKNALIKDGWKITHDPLHLPWGGRDMYVDLGAEELLAAEKGGQRIAVEIKSFVGRSNLADLHNAIGQFVIYRAALAEKEPERKLFLAVPQDVFDEFFTERWGALLVKNNLASVIGFDIETEAITQWLT